MRIWISAAAVLASGLASAADGNWASTSVTPAQIAQRVQGKLAHLSGASLDFECILDIAGYGKGQMVGKALISSPTRYRVEFPQVGKTEQDPLEAGAFVADGSRFSIRSTKHTNFRTYKKVWSPAVPLSRKHVDPTDVTGAWLRQGAKMILGAIGGPGTPVSDLVRQSKAAGMTVQSQERKLTFRGHEYHNYRILITRDAGKKQALYEIVVDANRWLPVTMNTETRDSAGTSFFKWHAVGKGWNLKSGQKFEPASFKIGKD